MIYRLVAEGRRAWHAGVSSYHGRDNVNDFSIGLAFSNSGPGDPPEPYTDAQYANGAKLCADIWTRRGLDLTRITTHAAVSPGRKTDPWGHFDLHRFFVAVANGRFPPPDPFELRIAA